ncbi:SDR family NAD(P)-dependent oxidoreductase [Actinoplanes sp. NEAU-A12]|uniref:SDR family NAD(P)-dependent oxidoreductase n=1 Tax=Actinoplanes sandaracinus TaxID=3045177 RepID=A0ABT6WGY1_9ACTN|nr:SDR family NAD(P)-dependent oxidoreductase [Actinoplanes sandaracinus]MDI6098983.1 SDR family NAD(P)-dependent oxidoreductase [Actinoplanes sandaracinus]
MTDEAKTWFITGATSGIGRELTTAALRRGDNVAALARKADGLDDLARRFGTTLLTVPADVRDEAAVQTAVQRTVETFGRIDVVANNAGYGLFGAVEEAGDAQARAVFDTNVFGVLNVLRATLPVLRAQRSGHILQGSSVYGQSAHPGVGLLSATKYAVEGLSDALAAEVAPLGIRVTIVQPRFTATGFLSNLDVATAKPDYDGTVRAVQQAIGELTATDFADAGDIAAALLGVVDADAAPLRLALGTASAESMRTALQARLRDLDETAAVTAAV